MIKIYRNSISGQQLLSYHAPLANYTSSFVGTIPTNDWFTIYSMDFTTLPPSNYYGDGPVTFNDVVWNKVNSINSKYMSSSINGFEIQVTNTVSDWWNSARTFPGLVLPLRNVFSGSFVNLDNISDFDLRVITQMSGQNENSSYEQIECGLEISASLPINNHIGYTLRSGDDGGSIYRGVVRTVNNVSADTSEIYTDFNCTVVSFVLENSHTVDTFIYSPPLSMSLFPVTNSMFATQVSKLFWNNYSFNAQKGFAFNKYSDLNYCFGPNTGNPNKDQIGWISRFYVQVRSK